MHIMYITSELSPYVEKTAIAKESIYLAQCFQQFGHQVSAIIPSIKEVNIKEHSLARRLSPLIFSYKNREIECVRYDARTADGISCCFLDAQSQNEQGEDEDFGLAAGIAAAFAESVSDKPDVCIFFGKSSVGFAQAARQYPQLAQTALLAYLPDITKDTLCKIPYADRIVVPRTSLLTKDEKASSKLAVIPKAVSSAKPNDKRSLKTSFQLKSGLKVRSESLLTFFYEFTPQMLSEYLMFDVQAVVLNDRKDCSDLFERYPDRLKAVPQNELFSTVSACDACVVGSDDLMLSSCLARATLPIITSELKDLTVDLESDLSSGTVIEAGTFEPTDWKAGVSRLVSAFKRQPDFENLVSRLPTYAFTWQKAASYILQLIEEVKTENK